MLLIFWQILVNCNNLLVFANLRSTWVSSGNTLVASVVTSRPQEDLEPPREMRVASGRARRETRVASGRFPVMLILFLYRRRIHEDLSSRRIVHIRRNEFTKNSRHEELSYNLICYEYITITTYAWKLEKWIGTD